MRISRRAAPAASPPAACRICSGCRGRAFDRHRVLVVAGRHSPGVSEPAPGESTLALAGGVNVILRPEVTFTLSRAHMMAPDGRCKASTAARTASCAPRAAASSCSSGSPMHRPTATDLRGDSRIGVEPGWPHQRAHRAERAGQEAVIRAALALAGLSRRYRLRRSARHGYVARRSDRDQALALRSAWSSGRRATARGLGEDEYRAPRIGGGRCWPLQGGSRFTARMLPPNLHLREPNPQVPWKAWRSPFPLLSRLARHERDAQA